VKPHDIETIGTLVGQLVADGKAFARAEVDIYRHKALAWVPPVRTAAILAVVALFLAQAAITTLLVFLGFWLSLWLGPLGGGVAAALIGLAFAGLLVWIAISKLKTPAGGRP
jgi:hypothetical protein